MRFWIAAPLVILAPAALAGVIGKMKPAEPITTARIAQLPKGEQTAWTAYLAKSNAQLTEDKASLIRERAGGPAPDTPPIDKSGGSGMPLDRDAAFYAGPEARLAADNIVSFQTPAGGWGKNVDRAGPARVKGQHMCRSRSCPPMRAAISRRMKAGPMSARSTMARPRPNSPS